MSDDHAAEAVTDAFAALCDAFKDMQEHVVGLAKVHESMEEFNDVFGVFQQAISLNASCLAHPVPPPPPAAALKKRKSNDRSAAKASGIPAPQVNTKSTMAPAAGGAAAQESMRENASAPARPASAANEGGAGTKRKAAAGKGTRGGKAPASGRQTKTMARMTRKAPPPRQEEAPWKWDKNLKAKIPKKYQAAAELNKLENILIYLKNRRSGITIADLVKHSGLAVIRCKEILQALMKMEVIHRVREKNVRVAPAASAGLRNVNADTHGV
ncbi:TPA: hypothetical protein N0F65_004656, partial [Lagenidium giganteum]